MCCFFPASLGHVGVKAVVWCLQRWWMHGKAVVHKFTFPQLCAHMAFVFYLILFLISQTHGCRRTVNDTNSGSRFSHSLLNDLFGSVWSIENSGMSRKCLLSNSPHAWFSSCVFTGHELYFTVGFPCVLDLNQLGLPMWSTQKPSFPKSYPWYRSGFSSFSTANQNGQKANCVPHYPSCFGCLCRIQRYDFTAID